MSTVPRRIKPVLAFGEGLPAFPDQASAETALLQKRDEAIAALQQRLQEHGGPSLDFSVDSLLPLEPWYLAQAPRRRWFGLLPAQRDPLAMGLACYWGEVVVRTVPGARWVVEEFPFLRGRYEIGVRKDLCTVMVGSFESALRHPKNKKRNSLWRTYHHYFGTDSKARIDF